jgi:hypothetical protein
VSDIIEIAVVGAHLSGLALNHELTSRGGVLLRAVSTEPSYRFYALAGGPPRRPGLLRVAAGSGHAIAAEVWALPPAGFAQFVAAIPAPLGRHDAQGLPGGARGPRQRRGDQPLRRLARLPPFAHARHGLMRQTFTRPTEGEFP